MEDAKAKITEDHRFKKKLIGRYVNQRIKHEFSACDFPSDIS